MAEYGNTSKERLATCHLDIQTVMNEVIKYFDNTIVSAQRLPEEQFELFKKGREEQNGKWVIVDKKKVVTYKDGYEKTSKHNETPLSDAVDAVPYPIDWEDHTRMNYFAGFVMGISKVLKNRGIIDHELTWGADWDNDTMTNDQKFVDRPHFQIRK